LLAEFAAPVVERGGEFVRHGRGVLRRPLCPCHAVSLPWELQALEAAVQDAGDRVQTQMAAIDAELAARDTRPTRTVSQQSHLAKLRHIEPGVHETRDAPPGSCYATVAMIIYGHLS